MGVKVDVNVGVAVLVGGMRVGVETVGELAGVFVDGYNLPPGVRVKGIDSNVLPNTTHAEERIIRGIRSRITLFPNI
jgi:hypothetical protein